MFRWAGFEVLVLHIYVFINFFSFFRSYSKEKEGFFLLGIVKSVDICRKLVNILEKSR